MKVSSPNKTQPKLPMTNIKSEREKLKTYEILISGLKIAFGKNLQPQTKLTRIEKIMLELYGSDICLGEYDISSEEFNEFNKKFQLYEKAIITSYNPYQCISEFYTELRSLRNSLKYSISSSIHKLKNHNLSAHNTRTDIVSCNKFYIYPTNDDDLVVSSSAKELIHFNQINHCQNEKNRKRISYKSTSRINVHEL
ncbi:MAG: hypothetical protein V4590_05920 [Bacteroidota bacterium]